MAFLKRIHPAAALFVGILVAFTLPLGYSAQGCGATTAEYRGVDLLVGDVDPVGTAVEDEEYATAVSHRGLVFAWLLLAAAVLGLGAAVFRAGRFWATWCAVIAVLVWVVGLTVIEAGEPLAGWFLSACISAGGVALKILIALARAIWRRLGAARPLATAVTTPGEPVVR